jgi:hypothetical protein
MLGIISTGTGFFGLVSRAASKPTIVCFSFFMKRDDVWRKIKVM